MGAQMRFENPDDDIDCAFFEERMRMDEQLDAAFFNGILLAAGICAAFAVLMSL